MDDASRDSRFQTDCRLTPDCRLTADCRLPTDSRYRPWRCHMTMAELLLPEFDQEMAATRRMLERVRDDTFAWKPHDKSFSMGALASHIANMVTWTVDTMNRAEFDLDTVTAEEMN